MFQGIPSLNLDLKKEVYVRENILPTFILERVPSKNREDLYDLLKEVNLTYIDPIEYLCRTKYKYSGDNFFMTYYEEYQDIMVEDIKGKNTTPSIIKCVLNNLALGNKVFLKDGLSLTTKEIFKFLYYLYEKSYKNLKINQIEGIENKKKEGKYLGRKPKPFSYFKMLECLERIDKKEMTSKEACVLLGISLDKFYREKKKILKNK